MSSSRHIALFFGRIALLAGAVAGCGTPQGASRGTQNSLPAGTSVTGAVLPGTIEAALDGSTDAAPDPTNGISCVLYARKASGIDLRGDAYAWWDLAAGRYLRGQQPEVGAVLVLAQSDRLHLGHLAVVKKIIDDRDILVDHSNWVPGRIITGMQVRDVSADNDWTELRFLNPDYGVFGSIYPADGFIYQLPQAPQLSMK